MRDGDFIYGTYEDWPHCGIEVNYDLTCIERRSNIRLKPGVDAVYWDYEGGGYDGAWILDEHSTLIRRPDYEG